MRANRVAIWKEAKFGYGLLLLVVSVPFLVSKLVGPIAGLIAISLLTVVLFLFATVGFICAIGSKSNPKTRRVVPSPILDPTPSEIAFAIVILALFLFANVGLVWAIVHRQA